MKIKQLFAMLEARNQIASVFNLPKEVLTIALSKQGETVSLISFRSYSDYLVNGLFHFGSLRLIDAIDKANFDENLYATASYGNPKFALPYNVETYSVRVFVELAPRKVKR